jgi:lysophospholipase L1-like esterase
MKIRTTAYLVVFSLFSFSFMLSAAEVAPGDSRILVRGCKYPQLAEGSMSFPRFSAETYSAPKKDLGFNEGKATTTSGVRLMFKSDASAIRLKFHTVKGEENRGSEYGLFVDGVFSKLYQFKQKDSVQEILIEGGAGTPRLYELALPSWSNPYFDGLSVEGGKLYECSAPQQKVYVSLGDSISHGVGQGSAAYRSWPYRLATQLNADLYNCAVGGGVISIPAAKQLKDWAKIDFMTILIGYNDWANRGKTVEEYKNDYRELLKSIRASHPDTKLFCISMLYTRTTESKRTKGTTAPQFRQVVYDMVGEFKAAGDANIFLIKGEELTDETYLRGEAQPNDPVHLGEKGAEMLAEKLTKIIGEKL